MEEVPSFTLPLSIARFLDQPDDVEWRTDHDYFEALLAVEMARSLCYHVGRCISRAVFSLSETSGGDSFAQPTSDLCLRGKDMHEHMKDVVTKLDDKRILKLKRMQHRPVVEKFLDAMKATELERRIFRFVLIQATHMREACDMCQQIQRQFRVGDTSAFDTLSVSFHMVRDIFQETSIAMLMSVADAQSSWVKEQIYLKASSPLAHIAAMDEATMLSFVDWS